MVEQTKEIRRICMVSSEIFNVAALSHGWLAPVGAALGLAVDFTEDKKEREEEFELAIEATLNRMKNTNLNSNSKKEILEELGQKDVTPDTLSELITKTEAYQTNYCTKSVAKEIINEFEMIFRDEIAKSDYLSNIYIMSKGTVTIDKLKRINEILVEGDNKLNHIQGQVSMINNNIEKAKEICSSFFYSIAFILVSMAIFLGMDIFLFHSNNQTMVIVALICYGISDFLAFFLNENKNKYFYKKIFQGSLLKRTRRFISFLLPTFLLPIILTVSCFWIILWALGMGKDTIFLPTIGLIMGNSVSVILKKI